jgi:hypothetical protein
MDKNQETETEQVGYQTLMLLVLKSCTASSSLVGVVCLATGILK